ncbi:MAG: divalent-cation tolerance protein CutA [Chitinivibrionales bacterium]|nr:divalent-cation tolerance protein CutA [Chitinivibrionales bacterium]
MKCCFIYITTAHVRQARRIGKALVGSRLAACVNILVGMNSLYWWEGKIQDDREAVLIAKTRRTLVTALINKVKAMHSYTCPCIVALPIIDGNPDYLKWIQSETRSPEKIKNKPKKRS